MKDSKKTLQSLTDLGIFDPFLDINEVWIAYARNKLYRGWAIVGAKSPQSARYYLRKKSTGWVESSIITNIRPIEEDYVYDIIPELKSKNLYPTEYGEWFELEWGI